VSRGTLAWLRLLIASAEIVTLRTIVALVAGAVGVAITFRAEARVPGLKGLTGSLAILGGAGRR